MRGKASIYIAYITIIILVFGCSNNNINSNRTNEIPIANHDLSYTPFDSKLDNPNYKICDSTKIVSGRNRLEYIGGRNELKQKILDNYLFQKAYKNFSGYIVIRFIHNCEGITGRFRVQSLDLDFSPLKAPSILLDHSLNLVKRFDNWQKSKNNSSRQEYSKYINLKISNGQLEHVLL